MLFNLWKRHTKTPEPPKEVTVTKDPVVDQAKQRTHAAAKLVTKESARLNKAFTHNGVTMNIVKMASGGPHGH